VQIHVNTIAEYFLFKTAVNQRLSQKPGLISLVFLTSALTILEFFLIPWFNNNAKVK